MDLQEDTLVPPNNGFPNGDESVPVSEEMSERESQGGVLPHLKDGTPAVL